MLPTSRSKHGTGVGPGQNDPTIYEGDVDDVVERIVDRSTVVLESIACNQMLRGGILRESVCLNSARSGTALGTATSTSGNGTTEVTVRNVTAVATGEESFGVNYRMRQRGTRRTDLQRRRAKA